MSYSIQKIIFAGSQGPRILTKIGDHHYSAHFQKIGYQVCWLTHPISPLHYLSGSYTKNAREIDDKYQLWKNNGEYHNDIFYYTPLTLFPFSDYLFLNSDWVLKNNLKLTFPNLERFLRKNDFNQVDVLWISNPLLIQLADIVKHKTLIYRIADDVPAFGGVPGKVDQVIADLIKKADAVFATAKTLLEKYAWAGEKLHYLPNGVDFNHFYNSTDTLPEEFHTIPSPRAIYVGMIADWFDVDIINDAAKQYPHVSFVLIGEAAIDLSAISSLPNVYVLGGRPYSTIPAYLKNSDVGLIPFKRNRLVESVNPIKLYEYMACGLPVLSSRWETIEGLGSPAYLYDSFEEFLEMMDASLSEEIDRQKLIDFAQKNSWEKQFNKVIQVLDAKQLSLPAPEIGAGG
jgi:glycosyltransferase involved in cell wall biosynthesis